MPVELIPEADEQFPPTQAAPLDDLSMEPAPEGPATMPAALEVASAVPARTEPGATIATFFYARLHNFGAACQTMGGQELTGFVNDVRRILSSAVLKLGGEIAARRPDSILCVFTHRPEDQVPNHARRALHAAILTVHEAMQLSARVAARPMSQGVPPLSLAVGVHLGPGEVTPRPNKANATVHAVGEAVEIARLLEVTAADLHWSVVTTAATRQAAGPRVSPGRTGSLGLPDDTFLEVVEVAGLLPRSGSATPESHYQQLRESLQANQRASRAALSQSMGQTGVNGMAATPHLLIEGYRLLRKIGEGGIASVYLAQPTAGGAPQVLKVMRLDKQEQLGGLQRFLQEYALLTQVDHPNVARIFRQDFSAGSAYIAMEYFPLGDLRARMRRPLDPAIALYYIKQIAAGLEAIHHVGIVHRDLKPDNVMVRADGMVAIADFGIAKQVSMLLTDTGDDEVVGTPYYLSPEQAQGHAVDARTDLYSLGILAYEMLTGQKPYHASTAEDLLRMHIEAPVPTLPAQHAWLQPALDRMMAKNPAGRYASAGELLDELEKLG